MNLIKKAAAIALILVSATSISFAQELPIYLDDSKNIEERVKDALSRMTLEEKVQLCHAQGKLSSYGVDRLGIPEVWWTDGPHGVRAELQWNKWGSAKWTNDSVTAFPALTALASTWNPELAGKYGKALGEEMLYREKDVLLGPGINIYRTPLCGRNFEYLGEDPYLVSRMCVPYIQEVQKNGIATCVKHYALNNQETNRDLVDINVSERALHEIYLPGFKAAVMEGGSWSIMGSYNKIGGVYACSNVRFLDEILREEWGFDGAVVSDWGGVKETYRTAMAGLDVEMGSYTDGLTSQSQSDVNQYYLANPYIKALKSGEIPMSTVDKKAANILRLIFRTAMNRNRGYGIKCNEEHYNTAIEIGNEGIVLLKNEPIKKGGDNLLPINASKYNKILVVGDNATRYLNEGGGSSELKVKHMITPLDALKAKYGDKIEFAQGYYGGENNYGKYPVIPQELSESLRKEAVAKAADADLVIMIGGLNKTHGSDCEGGDRREFGLPFGQDELINELISTNKNIVLVLLSGNAVEMPWIDNIPAIVQGWYLGSMGGYSLTNVLSGDVNPSGKLPFSFPAKLEDNLVHALAKDDISVYPGDNLTVNYKEDIFVGYRHHDTHNVPALFPFGHGLSYTTFDYGKASISSKEMRSGDKINVSIKVTNSGKCDGKEIIQLYIGDEKSSLPRPLKELKGFDKVSLKVGESTNVTFTIDEDDLKFYDDRVNEWVAEDGKFTIYIGASSTDIKSKIDFTYKK